MVEAHQLADSFKLELRTAKGDKRIDNLNLLSDTYYWIWDDNDKDLDTSRMYADQAYELAIKSTYKRGLGYALLYKASYMSAKTDNNANNNDTEPNYKQVETWAQQAIKIGEKIKDYRLVGDAYHMLAGLERSKGSKAKYKDYVEKVIFYYEKPVTIKLTGLRNVSKCEQCQGNEWLLGRIYQQYAQILASEGKNISEVNRQIDKAIFHVSKFNSKWALGDLFLSLGQVAIQSINLEVAAEYLQKAVALYNEAHNSKGELDALRDLCRAYWNLGDFENGLNISRRSLTLTEKQIKTGNVGSADSLRLEQAYFWMALFYEIAGDYTTAFDYFNKARIFLPADGAYETPLLVALGDLHRKAGNYDSAKVYLMQFEKRNGGKPVLANLYVSLKQYDDALRLIDLAMNLPVNRDNPLGRGTMFLISANAYLGKNNLDKALINARQGVALVVQMKRNVYLPDGYKVLSDILDKLGKPDSALYYFKKYSFLKDSLLTRQFYFRLSDYKKEAEEERRTSQINLLNKDNQLKQQQLKQEATLRKSLIVGILLLLLLGVFIFRNLTLKRKSELQKQKLKNEKKQTELEMQALRAQMNPHFIFNCLSSINRFILKNEGKTASNYLTRFSRLMRMVLNNSQKSLISLDDELEMLEIYLEMERLRFKDSFDYAITFLNVVDSDNIFIPPLLLQPFCENAIWHGLMHKERQGRLDIELSMEDTILNCVIRDNGVGREKAEELKSKTAEKEKSMGLKITTERLALLNREKGLNTFYEIEDVKDENEIATGTKVTLKISFKKSIEENVLS